VDKTIWPELDRRKQEPEGKPPKPVRWPVIKELNLLIYSLNMQKDT
jgi:hypothetical protein